jgi:hypothetical protein
LIFLFPFIFFGGRKLGRKSAFDRFIVFGQIDFAVRGIDLYFARRQ